MLLGIGVAALAPRPSACAGIVALGGLDCGRLASSFDDSQAVSAAHLRNARIAMPPPPFQYGGSTVRPG